MPIAGKRKITGVVFPVLLNLIHGPVGGPDKFFRAFHALEITFLQRADPDTDRDGYLEVAVIEGARLRSRADALGNELGLSIPRAGHEKHKLLASESHQDILPPAETLEEHGHIPEKPVAGEVAVSVVDPLEVIQIDE